VKRVARHLRTFSGSREVLGDMVRFFLEDVPQRLAVLERAMRDNDADTAADMAHALVNAASVMRASEIMGQGKRLEAALRQGRPQEAAAAAAAVGPQIRGLLEYLRNVEP
jgi:HPt (histidine-containing phosphotransfer) domain-containing protein